MDSLSFANITHTTTNQTLQTEVSIIQQNPPQQFSVPDETSVVEPDPLPHQPAEVATTCVDPKNNVDLMDHDEEETLAGTLSLTGDHLPRLKMHGRSKKATVEKYKSEPDTLWKVDYIPLTVATSADDATALNINFADCIGCLRDENGKHINTKSKERFYLLPEYNQNTKDFRAGVLGPLFAKACAITGTKISIYGYEKRDNRLVFACYRCRCYRNYRDPDKNGGERTTIPSMEKHHKCKFKFHVLWDDALSRWYVKKLGGGTRFHNAHPPENPTGHFNFKLSESEMSAIMQRTDPLTLAHPYILDVTRIIEEPHEMFKFQTILVQFKKDLQNRRFLKEQGVDVPLEHEKIVATIERLNKRGRKSSRSGKKETSRQEADLDKGPNGADPCESTSEEQEKNNQKGILNKVPTTPSAQDLCADEKKRTQPGPGDIENSTNQNRTFVKKHRMERPLLATNPT